MAIKFFLFFCFLAFAHSALADSSNCTCTCSAVQRQSFPSGFVFGAAGSAYQTEGAWNRDGKGPSIWDTFTHLYPDKIADGSNGDLAIDGYDLYKGDMNVVADLGLDVYRFSIAWSRILPSGQLKDGVNQDGIDYYNNLINALRAKGVHPCVTMFHWDVPQALESLYGGFLSPRIVEDFRDYADVLFKNFGDRVMTWITVNEPWTFSFNGYDTGGKAPGRCTFWGNVNCTGGDSGTEPYLVTHHQLLAHAAAVELYRQNYQKRQGGSIGITLVTAWFLPFRDGNEEDLEAAETQQDFMFGWFMNPVTFGDYPATMKARVGERLPNFTKEESKMLNRSYDFVGLNYYTAQFTHFYDKGYVPPYPSYTTDGVNITEVDSEGHHCGFGPAGVSWLQVYPLGLKEILNYTKVTYDNPTIFITENGVCTNQTLTEEQSINDTMRIDYIEDHLCCVLEAIHECKVNVSGYIVWSLFDNFEWDFGYDDRFGLYYVDYDSLTRIPKRSAAWYKGVISKTAPPPPPPSLIREYPSSVNHRKFLPAEI